MLITLEGDNLKAEDVFVLDKDGKIVALNLPQKLVLMANHQVGFVFYGVRVMLNVSRYTLIGCISGVSHITQALRKMCSSS